MLTTPTSYRIGKPTKCKNTPQHTKNMRLAEIPLQIPPGILKNYEIRIFGVFFWYFRGIFSIPCRRGNLYVGLVFLAYFGVCGVFCSVAGALDNGNEWALEEVPCRTSLAPLA